MLIYVLLMLNIVNEEYHPRSEGVRVILTINLILLIINAQLHQEKNATTIYYF